MPRRPCLDCGALTQGSRCPACTAPREAVRSQARDAVRGNSAQRGYGYAHRKRRAELLPKAYGKPCARCGMPILPGQALDAGHSTALAHDPHSKADRIEHALCNRRAGARMRKA
jgi:hypothetical protein